MSISNVICPFCNKEIENFSDQFFQYLMFQCNNHKNDVYIVYSDEKLDYYVISYKDYRIFIYKDDEREGDMNIEHKLNKIISLPVDNTLTPENIDTKLKTYLTFQ